VGVVPLLGDGGPVLVGPAVERPVLALEGEERSTPPATTERWAACEPEFRTFDGWPDQNWAAVAEEGYDALDENARTYLAYVANEVDAAVYAVGVGPGRDETVVVEDPWE
jgi:adenylosuccinate synthase